MKQNIQPHYFETATAWHEYELLDSGDGKILERFGKMVLVRPYAQAFWPKSTPELWQENHARFQADVHNFGGKWLCKDNAQKSWPLRWEMLRFQTQLGASQHIGIFPEEIKHWLWLQDTIKKAQNPVKVLNLWAYTGLMNLIATHAGADVTHVDSSKHGIGWAMANQKLSGMKDAPIRYIQEEPLKFIKREARREKNYNALILQFPRMEIEEESRYTDFLKQLPDLILAIKDILDPNPQFILITAPSCIHPVTTQAIVDDLKPGRGTISSGVICLKEKSAGHLLPHASFTRWSSN